MKNGDHILSIEKHDESELIRQNIYLHEKIAVMYDKRHSEIYNDHEQERLRLSLQDAVATIKSQGTMAMDYGCGAGNLTRHLVGLGMEVVAADVTPSFASITASLAPDRVRPLILNGRDLEGVEDESFDLIATYSVLHHIPDYLSAIREMTRVLRPGGVIYLDHEASMEHWAPSPTLREFRSKTAIQYSFDTYLHRLLSPKWWVKRVRKTINPRYAEEGDIHVWPDDHIEWEKIRALFIAEGVEILRDESYLLYQPHYSESVWRAYKDNCSDMHILVGRKRQ